ncbi:MAG: DUF2784 domain-containing protein [bacterium]|nr:DUF2784 domain-containing protein [bacterium]
MLYRILADLILVIHLAWIVFMLCGGALTIRAFWRPSFFDRWLFRSLHLGGILFVGIWELMGRFCPLTIWEYDLRRLHDPNIDYPGSFIVDIVERLVYPEVDLWMVTVPTFGLALFTLVMFVLRPPSKFQRRKAGPDRA